MSCLSKTFGDVSENKITKELPGISAFLSGILHSIFSSLAPGSRFCSGSRFSRPSARRAKSDICVCFFSAKYVRGPCKCQSLFLDRGVGGGVSSKRFSGSKDVTSGIVVQLK